jgi:hypothetical protein
VLLVLGNINGDQNQNMAVYWILCMYMNQNKSSRLGLENQPAKTGSRMVPIGAE